MRGKNIFYHMFLLLFACIDRRADVLAERGAHDVRVIVDVEHDERNLVVHAERRRRRIHDLQALVQDFDVLERLELLRIGELVRIAVVDAVRALLRHQDDVRLDFGRAQCCRRVRRFMRFPIVFK